MPQPTSRSQRVTKHRPPKPIRKIDAQIRLTNEVATIAVDGDWLKELAHFALAAEKIDRSELSIALVDDATIHRLNLEFLKHDYPTDVITFPLAHGKLMQGEIVIGLEFAEREAPEFGWTTIEETGLYLVHGILHLCDYRDDDEVEAAIMKDRQEELLRKFIADRGLPVAKPDAADERSVS